jgi:hypothetical protein
MRKEKPLYLRCEEGGGSEGNWLLGDQAPCMNNTNAPNINIQLRPKGEQPKQPQGHERAGHGYVRRNAQASVLHHPTELRRGAVAPPRLTHPARRYRGGGAQGLLQKTQSLYHERAHENFGA